MGAVVAGKIPGSRAYGLFPIVGRKGEKRRKRRCEKKKAEDYGKAARKVLKAVENRQPGQANQDPDFRISKRFGIPAR
jgi:hypothetical protein